MGKQENDYITLKEAATLSGYAPDYLGQLIRQGKIKGKQVYASVAWVTTKDALRAYMADEAKPGKDEKRGWFFDATPEKLSALYVWVGKAVLLIVGLFALLLFYVFAVSVDQTIEASYLEKIEYAP